MTAKPITLTRRNVIATFAAGSAVMMCPALLNAQEVDLSAWADIPTTEPIGQAATVDAPEGPAEFDVSTLQPGEVAVIARPNAGDEYVSTRGKQYVGILHRTDAQIQAAGDAGSATQDPRYLVVNLVCPHRGKAVGITGNENVPFACTDRGDRHASDFSAAGVGVAGASNASDVLSMPDYTIEGTIVKLA